MSGTVLIKDSEAAWYARQLADRVPGFRYVAAETAEKALPHAPEAHVLIGLAPFLPTELVAAAERLEWVQALTTGVDHLLKMPELPRHVAVTNCHGIHGPQMSELALLLMLACARRFPQMLRNQNEHRWQAWPQPLLWRKTVCILGLGAIAERLAAVCTALGMHVTGVSDSRSEAPGVARVYSRAELHRAAAEADFLIVLVPHTPRTHHIVDAGILAAMKPSAFLVNIARGGCVDEAALVDALRSGAIAGAASDVAEIEPLPSDDPLWSAPNMIVTPHVGGFADVYREQALPILATNLKAYAAGGIEALPNRIPRSKEER